VRVGWGHYCLLDTECFNAISSKHDCSTKGHAVSKTQCLYRSKEGDLYIFCIIERNRAYTSEIASSSLSPWSLIISTAAVMPALS
jgi:hypothetical protein